jgi:hypothetical protein
VKRVYCFRANLNININVITFSLVKCLAKVLARTAHKLRQSRAARSGLPMKNVYCILLEWCLTIGCGFVSPELRNVLLVTVFYFVYTHFYLAKYLGGVQIMQNERGGACVA